MLSEEKYFVEDFITCEHNFFVVVNCLDVIPKTLHKKQIYLHDGEYKCEHGSLEYFEIASDDDDDKEKEKEKEENPSTPPRSKDTAVNKNKVKKEGEKEGGGEVIPELVDKSKFIFWNDYGECV